MIYVHSTYIFYIFFFFQINIKDITWSLIFHLNTVIFLGEDFLIKWYQLSFGIGCALWNGKISLWPISLVWLNVLFYVKMWKGKCSFFFLTLPYIIPFIMTTFWIMSWCQRVLKLPTKCACLAKIMVVFLCGIRSKFLPACFWCIILCPCD